MRRGGTLHDGNDGSFSCVFYEADDAGGDSDTRWFRRDPRDWGRRRCVRNGGTFTEWYSAGGDKLESSCAPDPAGAAAPDRGGRPA